MSATSSADDLACRERWTAPSRSTTSARRQSALRDSSCHWVPPTVPPTTRRMCQCPMTATRPCRCRRRGRRSRSSTPCVWWPSAGSFRYDARTNRRRMTAHHPAPSQWSSGSLPAIPASSLGSTHEETDEPDREHDQRDPPQHVNRKSEPAEDEREQQHQQNGTHGLSPPCRTEVFPEFRLVHLL